MSTKRGICPECKTEKRVNADGTMRYHFAAGNSRYRGDCPGYGLPPAETVADPIAAAEARGYAKAIAKLRDVEAWLRWCDSRTGDWDYVHPLNMSAQFLEAEATKETTDHGTV